MPWKPPPKRWPPSPRSWRPGPADALLTPAESRVLDLLRAGHPNAETAFRRGRSPRTIAQVSRIFAKLGVRSREGNWKQLKGRVRVQWGKLTEDHLDVIAGKREQLVGRVQEQYGIGRDRRADRRGRPTAQLRGWRSHAAERGSERTRLPMRASPW